MQHSINKNGEQKKEYRCDHERELLVSLGRRRIGCTIKYTIQQALVKICSYLARKKRAVGFSDFAYQTTTFLQVGKPLLYVSYLLRSVEMFWCLLQNGKVEKVTLSLVSNPFFLNQMLKNSTAFAIMTVILLSSFLKPFHLLIENPIQGFRSLVSFVLLFFAQTLIFLCVFCCPA